MASQTETAHVGEFLIAPSDDMGTRSFDVVTLDQNLTAVQPGTILGTASLGAGSAVFAALGTNTGNPTCGAITVAAGTAVGEYDVVMEDATHFAVLQPPLPGTDAPGEEVGHGVFGSAFSGGGLGFTITAGGTPCVPGDSFKITVTDAAASNAGNSVPLSLTATDGTQIVAGILYGGPYTTGAGVTVKATAVTRHAEVNANLLTYPAGASGGQIAAINAALAAKGIIVRTGP